MANYPDEFFEFRDIENIPDVTFDPDDKRRLFAEDIEKIAGEVAAINNLSYRSLAGLVNINPVSNPSSPTLLLSYDIPSVLISDEGARLHLNGVFSSTATTDGSVTFVIALGGVPLGSYTFDTLPFNIITPTADIIKSDEDFFLSFGNAYNNANIIDNFISSEEVILGDPTTSLEIYVISDASEFENLFSFIVVDFWRVENLIFS